MITNIKKARMDAGISQKEVAVTLGVSAPSVSDWEAGKNFPNAKNLVQLANLLNVSTDYLLGNEKAAPSEDEATDETIQKIMGEVNRLPPEQRENLLSFLRGLPGL